jgi:TolB-like protein/DNA-binding winged helix-turn-helix (wHTH) protein
MSRKVSETVPKSSEMVRFGGFVFMTKSRQLQTVEGKAIGLRSQSTEVLTQLAAHPGEIVSKDALMQAVWPDTFVTDDSLTQCIADIRRAVGDAAHELVETVPKRGYRLNATPSGVAHTPTSRAADGVKATTGQRQFVPAAIAVIVVAIGVYLGTILLSPAKAPSSDASRIAVLPFDDFSVGPDKGFLSDAVAEGIITQLARSKTYVVISRNSSFKYRDQSIDAREMGTEIGADYLLAGSQQKSGNQLKVTAQLLNAQDGSLIWTNTYNREIGDLFVVQEEITRTLADRVGRRIEWHLTRNSAAQVSALSSYLMGRMAIRENFSADGNERLQQYSRQAIEADPNSQFGYVGLAWYYRNDAVFWHELNHDEALRLAAENADRAILLAADDSEAHHVRAQIHSEAGEVQQALARFDQAIALNPSDSDILVMSAGVLLNIGRVDEAIERIEQAKGIDPFHPDWFHWQMGWALWEKDDCEAALEAMRKMARIPVGAHRMLAGIYACLGNEEEAREALEVFLKDSPGDSIRKQRSQWEKNMTSESLERWIAHMRIAGLPE